MVVIPSLLPKSHELKEYLELLANSILPLWERICRELPAWAAEYRFTEDRERHGQQPSFPCLLIVNTNLKKAMSLADKDQDVAREQVEHASRNNVLILRTLDLLNLAALHRSGKLPSGEVQHLLTGSRGWLKVSTEGFKVLGME